jgi:hypothetical protein
MENENAETEAEDREFIYLSQEFSDIDLGKYALLHSFIFPTITI